jgi:DUF1009 family protein
MGADGLAVMVLMVSRLLTVCVRVVEDCAKTSVPKLLEAKRRMNDAALRTCIMEGLLILGFTFFGIQYFIKGFFHAREGKIEPPLKEVSPQLDRKAHGLRPLPALG